MRALAAWMVCLYHSAFLIVDNFPGIRKVLDWGQEGVYVFFVISGLILPYSMSKSNYEVKFAGKFMLKRMLRLYPPFLLSIILYTYFFNSWDQIFTSETFHKALDSALFLVPFKGTVWVNDIYWTLFVEFQYYIFLALLFPLISSENSWIRRISFLGTLALSFVSYYFHWVDNAKVGLFFHLPVFSLGFLLYLHIEKKIKPLEFWIGFLIAGLSCAYLTGNLFGLGYHIILTALFSFFIIYFIHSAPRWLNFIGEISYSFYLTHWVAINVIGNILYNYKSSIAGSLIIFFLIQVVAIAIAWFFYFLIEKRSLRLTKKIRY